MPPELLPTSFIESLAAALSVLACLFAALSLIPCIRAHTTKLFALLFVISLALFADHVATYFAALFIVATSVTELEFLQNLAAIIRGDRAYFEYKAKQLSKEQVEQKVREEQQELAGTAVAAELEPAMSPSSTPIHRIVELESKAINKLEQYFGKSIQRNISFSYGRNRIELDGFIPNEGRNEAPETFIEVKYLQSPVAFSVFKQQYQKIVERVQVYMNLTGEVVKLHVALITKEGVTLSSQQLTDLKRLVESSAVPGGFHVFSESQLSSNAT
jgi:Holliday junction resolvase-like predicted endonuclease